MSSRPPLKALGQTEFVALMAMLAASVAMSIDGMLPALPEIANDLSPQDPNRVQLVVTSYVLGLGIATLFVGPLADRFGRKPVVLGGAVLFISASLLATFAPTLGLMLAARVLMGMAAAAPRVVSVAIVRDLYSGREMARIVSFVMLVFSLVPALAPSLGAAVIALSHWRGVFVMFALFALCVTTWMMLRQPETLHAENVRPLQFSTLWAAIRECFAHPTVRLSILVQTMSYAMLFSFLSATQQIFDQTYDQGHTFHLWFGGIAVLAASASVVNARLVVRLGMRKIIKASMLAQIVFSSGMMLAVLSDLSNTAELMFYAFWTLTVFFQAGLTIGNLNALALEPLGHIAGSAASVVTATSTVGAVIVAIPIGLSFDGTPLPQAIGIFLCASIGFWLTTRIRRDSDEDAPA